MCTYFNALLRPRVETAFSSFTTIHDFVYMMTSQVWDHRRKHYGKWNRELGLKLYKKARFDIHVLLESAGLGTIK